MKSVLEHDTAAINDIFLAHQVHSLKLSDQKSLLDSLSYNKKSHALHIGDEVSYKGRDYWIEDIDGEHLLLKSGSKVLYRPRYDESLKKLPSNRLITLAEEGRKLKNSCSMLEFRLRSAARELLYNESRFASYKGSRVKVLPHQINAVYQILDSINHRYLLADEVGLGKTIEAGLLMKEFRMRYGYKKILIVVPASLQLQWQQELSDKFSEEFYIIDSRSMKKTSRSDFGAILNREQRFITSLDFAKQPEVAALLTGPIWDMVIFDEAHRLRRDRNNITKAYQFAESISYRTKSFFLLSATPFSGKPEELYYMIHLLDKNRLGSMGLFMSDYYNGGGEFLNGLLRDIVIRRTKKDVGGFTRRTAVTVKYRLNAMEQAFYDELSDYVRTEYAAAVQQKSNARALMLTFFQKMLDSSLAAIYNALKSRILTVEERILKLSDKVEQIEKNSAAADILLEADDEDLSDILDTSRQGIEDLKKEKIFLKHILGMCERIKGNTKQDKLVELVQRLKKENPAEKIIIFTQFKSSVFSLQDALSEYNVGVFHGSMNRDEKDRAILEFRGKGDILISTEAGGEGRNLQFSRIMVNYDLPWNPFRIEQRIGRIHRFGQKENVFIYNFAVEESIGERVLEILQDKIKVFEEAFGEMEAVLGVINQGPRAFDKLFMNLYLGKDVQEDLSSRLSLSREKLKNLAISRHYLAESMINTADIKKELKEITARMETFFQLYGSLHPEDFQIQETLGTRQGNVYLVSREGGENLGYMTFEYRVMENISSHTKLKDKKVEYLHLEHPLIKDMLSKCNVNPLQDSVLVSDEPTHAEFTFIVKLFYYIRENRCFRIKVPLDGPVKGAYESALKKLETRIADEKDFIINKNRKLIDREIEKIKLSFDKQIAESQYLLENYEFKNQQTEGDNYFLLIPKVKKHLKKLKQDYSDIVAITKEKLNIKTEYYLDSVELI